MKIARLIGGAGTGKTTELQRTMEAALPQLDHNPLNLGFASFTRAARAEAVGRVSTAWGVSPALLEKDGWFRTIHSTCKRCLDVAPGQLIGDTEKDREWISNALGVRLSTEIDDESGRHRFIGDPVVAGSINAWNFSRASMLPLAEVVRKLRQIDDEVPDYAAIVRVVEQYEMKKRLDDRLDFTDMLAQFAGVYFSPLDGVGSTAPRGFLPEVAAWLFDEQQDASPLLDAVCKRLVSAPSVRWCYVVGDPFQSIYGFAGSSAECFLGWPAAKERTMPKSYRCPKPILELGERCLKRLTRGYFDRGIAPADHEGEVIETSDIEHPISIAKPDEDWLFIARTNYQAVRLFGALQSHATPCRWVKSHDGATNRGEGLAALFALEKDEPITGRQWAHAVSLLPVTNRQKEKMLSRGVKTKWGKESAEKWDTIFLSDLRNVGAEPPLIEAIRTGAWCGLVDKGSQYRRQAMKHGAKVTSEPRIRVGTVHSVKGAEADNVAFLTTVGQRCATAMENPDQADEERRIAYVAVTRARRRLFVVAEGRAGRPINSLEVL
jgi:DNA helicase-2/ATP-dependent DNA helicase PcrA